jgi:outer membrane protein insertion porin family
MSRFLFLLLGAALTLPAWAFDPFQVEDIRVEGLQRIAAGTVFNYLPVKRGDRIDDRLSSQAVRALFKTGFFKDVVLEREGNTLVVFVAERPAIASIEVTGNSAIQTDQLLDSLKQVGLAEGLVFDRSLLDRIEQELKRQYLLLGYYAARVQTSADPRERNRVAVKIEVAEGEIATIRSINIVGSKAFSEQELLKRLESGVRPALSLFYSGDQYSRPKLAGDLETLRSFYLDRGYINFNIDSTQVAISPDKRDIYITVNTVEGEQYRVSEIKVAGDTIMPEPELLKLISLEKGDVFSRRRLTESATRISDRLGEVGYAFANVNPIPEMNDETREVSLTFFVDPGRRVYVRRVNITGNLRTRDEVLRREMRQMEGAPLETVLVNRSKTRLNRLGFFDVVNVETIPVPGHPDLVDVNFDVVERQTFGSLNAGIGYGDTSGVLVNVSVTQENFMGTGNRFTLALNNSEVTDEYSFSFTNPYYTIDGISRSLDVFYRSTDPEKANIDSGYTTDAYGMGVGFGVPLSEYNTFRFRLSAEHTRINTRSDTSQDIIDFCQDSATLVACEFDALKTDLSWSFDSRDRALFPTDGTINTIGSQLAIPVGGDSVSFYKVYVRSKNYQPIFGNRLIVQYGGELAYGDGYGDTTALPPFERYYAGGVRTVRGYRANSLGPRDEFDDNLGGNARALVNTELILPNPFSENSTSTRISAFLDGGNVFNTDVDYADQDMRFAAGLALYWFTPVGPLSFSIAQPLNDKDGDEIERFQFSLGAPF